MEKNIQKTNIPQETNEYGYIPTIDLNCDLAQSWGIYKHANEEAILPFVTSVNIACGGHAGDFASISKALRMAKERKLVVGAHIGYPDPVNFGRKEIPFVFEELQYCITSQLSFIIGIAKNLNIEIAYVRPHGALYYRCGADLAFAESVAKIIAKVSSWLYFVMPCGGINLSSVHENVGLRTIGEMHLDKIYRKDLSRKQTFSNLAKFQTFEQALAQAKSLIYQNRVLIKGNKKVRAPFRTIHLTADKPYSVELAEAVHKMLTNVKRLSSFTSVGDYTDFQIDDLNEDIKFSENLKYVHI